MIPAFGKHHDNQGRWYLFLVHRNLSVLPQLLQDDDALSYASGNGSVTNRLPRVHLHDHSPRKSWGRDLPLSCLYRQRTMRKILNRRNKYKPTNTFGTPAEGFCHCVSRGWLESALTLVYNDNPAFDCLRFVKLFVAPKMKQ